MSDKLEQLAIKYARAYRDLQLAKRALRRASEDMHEPDADETGQRPRRFNSYRIGPFSTYWEYEKDDKPVTDPEAIAIIARWQEAYAAKVVAARKLGALRAGFLRVGRILDAAE